MKPIALMSIGLLGSAVAAAGVTGYLAWSNLSGADMKSNQVATSAVAKPQTPPAPSPQPIAAPTEAVYISPGVTSEPAISQAENDFLFDLTQALQPIERDRLSNTARLTMARQITNWLNSGADYWSVRSQFDATYQNEIAGDYAFNREVYIKFAVERFAPDAWIALAPPQNLEPNPQNFSDTPDLYEPPYEAPYEPPYYEEAPIGIPAPHPVPPPYAEPPYPYPHPPLARPPYPYPDWEPNPYPPQPPIPQIPTPQPPIAQQPPIPQPPVPQQPPAPQPPPTDNPDWYQDPNSPSPPTPSPAPDSSNRDPNVTEISAPSHPTSD